MHIGRVRAIGFFFEINSKTRNPAFSLIILFSHTHSEGKKQPYAPYTPHTHTSHKCEMNETKSKRTEKKTVHSELKQRLLFLSHVIMKKITFSFIQ